MDRLLKNLDVGLPDGEIVNNSGYWVARLRSCKNIRLLDCQLESLPVCQVAGLLNREFESIPGCWVAI